MDITHSIQNYINSQNQKIWDELKPNYIFELIYNPLEYSYASKTEGNLASIITPTSQIDIDSFTHELLHVYMDYLGLSPYPDLIYSIQGINSMGIMVLESDLIAHLYNFCSHKKMFPLYREMGFSEYRFVESRISFSGNDLNYIKNGFMSNGKQAEYIHQFIGHTLALMNNVVEEDEEKCRKYLYELKQINSELYKIIEDFDNDWNTSNDLNLLEDFLVFEKRLDEWLEKSNLTFENDYCR